MKGSWQDFWYARQGWSFSTFGPPELRGPKGPLLHLKKELDKELLNEEDPTGYFENLSRDQLREEIADCIFLIHDAADRAGFSLKELLHECWRKLEINRQREWPTTTSDQPVEHIR